MPSTPINRRVLEPIINEVPRFIIHFPSKKYHIFYQNPISSTTLPHSPFTLPFPAVSVEVCLLSNNIYDYRIVSQGKTTIPSVDDGSEFEDTDVRIGCELLS